MNNRKHPTYNRQRWEGYLAFLWLIQRRKFRFNIGTGRAESVNAGTYREAARTNRNGYRRIPFRFMGRRFEIMEHVAFWIWVRDEFPKRGLQVNHKDLDRQNGIMDNLELVTASGNIKHRNAAKRAGNTRGGKR